jgi:hypothetical protein
VANLHPADVVALLAVLRDKPTHLRAPIDDKRASQSASRRSPDMAVPRPWQALDDDEALLGPDLAALDVRELEPAESIQRSARTAMDVQGLLR